MLGLLNIVKKLALDPDLVDALGSGDELAPNPQAAERVFQAFRAELSVDEAQPDIMALTDSKGRLIALMSEGKPITQIVPDTFLVGGKIKYPAIDVAIKKQIVTSDVWDYQKAGPMKVTVAPIIDREINATVGTLLVAYAVTKRGAIKQQKLLGAEVLYFYEDIVHTSSFEAKDKQVALEKVLFEGGLAEDALTSEKGLGDIKLVNYRGEEYLATTGRMPQFGNKTLDKDYPRKAGSMVLISLTKANALVGTAGMAILLIGLVSIVLLLIAIMLTAKRILDPLEEIELGINDIINGNLDRTFEPVGTDLDGMANALNVMLARLLGRPEPGEEEFDEDGNIIRPEVQLPKINQSGAIDFRQAEAEALAAEPKDAYLARVHREFSAGQETPVDFGDFVAKLEANEVSLRSKYNAREVRFKVVNDDGKVTLKPVPIM